MTTIKLLIMLYGIPAIALLAYIAMTLKQILSAVQSLHTDVWHQIYKDRI